MHVCSNSIEYAAQTKTAGSLMFTGAVLQLTSRQPELPPAVIGGRARDSQGYTRFATFMVAAATD